MTDIHSDQSLDLPGSDLDVAKMPGHWLVARLGKHLLRPRDGRGFEVVCST